MSKIVGIIPARWASTRFPGKMLYPIAGKPLIQHVWERCTAARRLDGVIIATDEERVAETVRAFGGEAVMTSPDFPTGTDRIAHVAAGLNRDVSHVINIQGDEPAISPVLIDRIAAALADDPTLEMVTAASAMTDPRDVANPNCVKVVLANNGDALYFSRSVIPHSFGTVASGSSGVAYLRHQGIYGYERSFLARYVRWTPTPCERAERLEQLRALENGARIRVMITDHVSQGVDSLEDVAVVEARLASEARADEDNFSPK